jgi:hypothetical protein
MLKVVGPTGFEPAASASRTQRSSQAELRSDKSYATRATELRFSSQTESAATCEDSLGNGGSGLVNYRQRWWRDFSNPSVLEFITRNQLHDVRIFVL